MQIIFVFNLEKLTNTYSTENCNIQLLFTALSTITTTDYLHHGSSNLYNDLATSTDLSWKTHVDQLSSKLNSAC
jgi:hypothetical protein